MTLHFKPLATNFAAEVVGLNPAWIDDSSVRAELNSAFEKYRLLLFRDVDYETTVGFEGASFEAGQQLLSNILDCAAEGEEYVRQWRVGDALPWNNLHLQHARIPLNSSEHRTLRRTTLM